MSCPLCGDICRCSADVNSASDSQRVETSKELPSGAEEQLGCSAEGSTPSRDDSSGSASEDSWRQEVAARLNRYQARRRPRPPRYPSPRLRFDPEDSAHAASATEP